MGKREKTEERILKMLGQYGRLNVGDAVSALQVSEATVRRYFADMEGEGKLLRIHGGVRPVSTVHSGEYFFPREAVQNVAAKVAIGRAAAERLDSHERLFFDSGTTVRECGNALRERLDAGKIKDVNVVTNSLIFCDTLATRCSVTLTGGSVCPSRMDLRGIVALQCIERYHFTKAILGADGISQDGTLTTTDEDTSVLAATALRQCQEVLILADSSKLGRMAFSSYGCLEGPRFTLVTDANASEQILDTLRERGVQIVVADSASGKGTFS